MKRLPVEYVGIIWGVFGVLAGMAMIFTGGNIVLIAILAAAAVFGTIAVAEYGGGSSDTPSEKTKRRADPNNMGALIELLDEEDLHEIRQRLKHRLIDRIETGSDGELSSLDALLAEQQSQKRR